MLRTGSATSYQGPGVRAVAAAAVNGGWGGSPGVKLEQEGLSWAERPAPLPGVRAMAAAVKGGWGGFSRDWVVAAGRSQLGRKVSHWDNAGGKTAAMCGARTRNLELIRLGP
eukprot:scaffold25845_cov112-Isochrysis_galbana.AAC.5